MLNERFEHLIEYMYTLSTYDTNVTSTKRYYGLGNWRCQLSSESSCVDTVCVLEPDKDRVRVGVRWRYCICNNISLLDTYST